MGRLQRSDRDVVTVSNSNNDIWAPDDDEPARPISAATFGLPPTLALIRPSRSRRSTGSRSGCSDAFVSAAGCPNTQDHGRAVLE